jgi:hypothetical protein
VDFCIADTFTASLARLNGAGKKAVKTTAFDLQLNTPGPGSRDADQIRAKIKGIDFFKPQTGEIESGGPDTIALWLIDTGYKSKASSSVRPISSAPTNDPLPGAEDDIEGRESSRSFRCDDEPPPIERICTTGLARFGAPKEIEPLR